jgi:hypothetical protein
MSSIITVFGQKLRRRRPGRSQPGERPEMPKEEIKVEEVKGGGAGGEEKKMQKKKREEKRKKQEKKRRTEIKEQEKYLGRSIKRRSRRKK